ncbi:MAG: ABC transporter substrate-binding protein [Candidatus Bathyarchaeota archaeon]|nr:ABC transporter substrate-binding protein [Candidatus Bathyarchaeota archaeon]
MKKTTMAIAAFIIGIVLIASTYGAYTLNSQQPPTPNTSPTPNDTTSPTSPASPTGTPSATTSTPTKTSTKTSTSSSQTSSSSSTPTPTPAPTSVTVTDGDNNTMTISLPVKKIAALDGGIAEILCAMGVQNLIVARTDSCTMPPSILNVTSYGENDYAPSVEGLISLHPDVIFASSMLPYNPTSYQQLLAAGIPVYIVDTTTPEPLNPSLLTKAELYALPTAIDFTCQLMQKFVPIVGHQDNVDAYVTWAQSYNKIVKDRIYTLASSQQVKTYLEWYGYGRTFVTQSVYQAGGTNIAENQTNFSPVLSSEFIVEQNPSAIIVLIASSTHNINDFIAAKNDVTSRPALKNIDAVKYDRVYVCDFYARSGVRSIIGYLYWAKWLQPSLFSDINPGAVNQELNQKFFGTAIPGTFAYP